MATFNNFEVVKRYNRPSILLRTLLEMYFTNNGTYFDPYEVSACYILPDTTTTNGSPDIYINRTASDVGTSAYGKLNASGEASAVATYVGVSAVSAYDPDGTPATASAIYKVDTGHYAIVADGGAFPEYSSLGLSDGKYFDAWLVRDFSATEASAGYKLYWNKFTVFNDRIISFTEPYQVTSKSKLQQRYLQLSSNITLRVNTETFVANGNMSKDLKTIFRDSVVTNPQIRITKRNPYTTGLITEILDWTAVGVDVSSDDTIMYTWDTAAQEKGDYIVQVKYDVLEQTFYSEEFSLVLR
jgi:hypothetical protein